MRDRRGARQHGLPGVGLGHERHRDHAPPGQDRLHGEAGPPRRSPGRGRRGGRVERDQGLQPRGRGRARAADPGDPARRDARRADADEVRDRDRRRARQDHDDDDDAHGADGGRARPDRGDRRPGQLARAGQRALGQERLPGRRGRRERRLVPDADADGRDGHQRRRRAPRSLRHVRQRQEGVHRLLQPRAVLRDERAVPRQPRRAGDPAAADQALHDVRDLRRRRPTGRATSGTTG